MKRTLLTLALLSATLAFAAVQSVSSSATVGKAKAGKVPVTVNISIPDGYHIYGPQAGKTGVATSIKVKGQDFKIAKATFPKTKPFKTFGEVSQVYENQVSVPLVIQPTKKLKGKQKIMLMVTTQACNDRTCLPPDTKTLAVTVNLGN
ncbi:MAG: protein-disulfide reductase DsbD N-terminal domain-containing protein [Armatimonadetes bacterium]|nr:protein-disulfide reductase DsbD N-terminal domain-containing protein [Armatimonadota bacterium]